MILTAAAIAAAHEASDITIDPCAQVQLSPNAYDWRLGEQIRVCGEQTLDAAAPTSYFDLKNSVAGDGLVTGVQSSAERSMPSPD